MSLSTGVRQTHRWVAMIFTVTVVANIVQLSIGQQEPTWITYAPLLPLGLLLLTGLYLFVLPYVAKRRSQSRAD